MHGLLESMHGVAQPKREIQMSDAQIAQAPFKPDVPPVDFSHVIGQTWQKPIQDAPRLAQIAPSNDVSNGYLELGDWRQLYGEHVIAQGTQKSPEAKDKVEPTADKKTEKAELSIANRGASPEYAKEVQKGLDSLPPYVKDELAKHHVEIYVFKNIDEYNKAFPGHKGGSADAGGMFDKSDPKHPRIAVFEDTPDGKPVKGYGYDPAGLLRHEVGHAHSFFNGYQGAMDLHTALGKEANQIKNDDPNKAQKMVYDCLHGALKYYFSNPDEMYAEMFAMATGGGSNPVADAYMMMYFANTIKYERDAVKAGK